MLYNQSGFSGHFLSASGPIHNKLAIHNKLPIHNVAAKACFVYRSFSSNFTVICSNTSCIPVVKKTAMTIS